MELNLTKLSAKAFALLIALVVVATMSFGVPAAHALNTGDVTGNGSITVHKLKTFTASDTAGTGTEVATGALPATAEPLAGVGFTLYPLDTAKVEGGVTGTPAVTAAPAASGVAAFNTTYGSGSPSTTVTTGADGKASFAALPLGYYLLVESTTPEGVTASVPAIITIPYNNGTNFVKDVHIYPKNVSTQDVTKTLDGDPTAIVSPGTSLTYDIVFSVPTGDDVYVDDTHFMTGTVTDQLPLNPAGAPMLTYKSFTAIGLTTNGQTVDLTESNFTVTQPSGNPGQVVFTYGKEAATEIDTYNSGHLTNQIEKIQLKVVTEVADAAYAGGVDENGDSTISNNVTVATKKADGTDGPGGGDESEDSSTIGMSVVKVNGKDTSKKLAGATFKLASSYSNVTAKKYVKANGADLTSTSNANGIVSFGGLTGDDVTDNAEISAALAAAIATPDTAATVDLWLVETTAPTDFRVLQAPQKVTLSIVKSSATGKVSCSLGDDVVSISNFKNGEEGGGNFMLPNTGGTGALIFIVVGALLVVVAGVYFARSRKRNGTPRSQQ